MNRRSLFGRFAAPLSIDRTAKRPEHRKVKLEALEDRKMLAVVYVNDNWIEDPALSNGTLEIGDQVIDVANSLTRLYGSTAFGTVTGLGTLPTAAFINDAINATNVSNGDTVSILEGTYTESDIVVNKQLTISGAGHNDLANNLELQLTATPYGEVPVNSATDTLIVPATSSSHVNGEFPVNTHSGIIIYSEGVTISNLRLDGSGNSGNTGAMAYHHGITTLYELQGGGNYVPFAGNNGNNGTNMPLVTLGASMVASGNRTRAKLYVSEVTVDNAWWHGITLSALSGQQYGQAGPQENIIANSTVRNVGDSGNQGASHIGIHLQNIDNFDDDLPFGNLQFSTVKNAGMAIQSNTFGVTDYGNGGGDATSQNRTTFSFNLVLDAVTGGLKTVNNADSNIIQNVFLFTASSTAIGIENIHSEPTYGTNTIGLTSSNAPLIGFKNSDTGLYTADSGIPQVLTNNNFVGRGTGVGGSIGVYSTTTADFQDATFVMGHSVNITGFETGVKVLNPHKMLPAQAAAGGTVAFLDRQGVQYNTGGVAAFNPSSGGVSGNKTGYAFGPNFVGGGNDAAVTVLGQYNTSDPVWDPGTTILGQVLPNLVEDYAHSLVNPLTPTVNTVPPAPTIFAPARNRADVIRTGSLTLGGGSLFPFLLNGLAGSEVILEDFNTSFDWAGTPSADADANINPWISPYIPAGRLGDWGTGAGVQSGGGNLVIDGVGELGGLYNFNGGTTTTVDAQNMSYLQVILRKGPGSLTAAEFAVSIGDQDGTVDAFIFPTAGLSTTADTTFQVSLMFPATRFVDGGDNLMDMQHMSGWGVTGTLGLLDFDVTQDLSLDVKKLSFVSGPRSSAMEVTGAVTITTGTAVLAPSMGFLFTNSIGQTYTVVNNDGTDAVTGLFAGLAGVLSNGSVVPFIDPLGGAKFTISYTGGTGNDVVLTQVTDAAPAVDLNGAGAGNTFANTWNTAAPVPVSAAGSTTATATDADDSHLVSMTATITSGAHASNVLDVTLPASQGLTKSFSAGVLTVTGQATKSVYQTVLRSLTYNNTGGGPGAGSVTIDVKTNDTLLNSNIATSTITIFTPSAATVANRQFFYNQSGWDGNSAAIDFVADASAIAPDKTAYIPNGSTATSANFTNFSRGINGIIIDIANNGIGTHANISASDFVFFVGNDNTPSSWAAAPAPSAVSVSIGGGLGGTDRVEITWASGSIINQWLEVGVKDTAATGLASTTTVHGTSVGDVFFFGNKAGDATQNFATNSGDGTNVVASGIFGVAGVATITTAQDINKNKTVNSGDGTIVVNNLGLPALTKLSVSGSGPFAPEGGGGGGGGDAGIASALAGSGGGGGGGSLPAAVADRLDSGSGGGGGGGGSSYFAQLAADDDASEDDGDDTSDLDELLDSLAG